MEFTDCPALDTRDQPCRALALLERMEPMESTHGPVEFVITRCVLKHTLTMPAAKLGAAGGRGRGGVTPVDYVQVQRLP